MIVIIIVGFLYLSRLPKFMVAIEKYVSKKILSNRLVDIIMSMIAQLLTLVYLFLVVVGCNNNTNMEIILLTSFLIFGMIGFVKNDFNGRSKVILFNVFNIITGLFVCISLLKLIGVI